MKKTVITLCNDAGAYQLVWLKASEFPDATSPSWGGSSP